MTSFSFDPERIGVASKQSRARSPANLFLLFFRLFRLRRLSPVVLVHPRVDALIQEHLHGVPCLSDHFRCHFHLHLLHRPHHVFFAAPQRTIRSATHTQPRQFPRSHP